MKKIMLLTSVFIIFMVIFIGCLAENESQSEDEVDELSNFYGTWTETQGKGTFTLGNSIRFNEDNTCDFFWENATMILANGTWDRTINSTGSYTLVIKLGENEIRYEFDFINNYKTLRLKQEGSKEYVDYDKKLS